MEPEAAAFLKKVANTIFIGFTWLAINAIAAIKGDNAFIGEHLKLGNVLFYIWFVISIVILIVLYKKMWTNR
ncbi:MAG TPA: hypothetical protein VF610_09195 [Segetibacter sp.]|jgi:hypothetical protein